MHVFGDSLSVVFMEKQNILIYLMNECDVRRSYPFQFLDSNVFNQYSPLLVSLGALKLHEGSKYIISERLINSYTWQLNLTIKHLQKGDFGEYTCTSVNALGKQDARIRLQGTFSTFQFHCKCFIAQWMRSQFSDLKMVRISKSLNLPNTHIQNSNCMCSFSLSFLVYPQSFDCHQKR